MGGDDQTRELVLYLHGRGGCAAEAEHYRPLFPGCEVLGLDYRSETPRAAGTELYEALERLRGGDRRVTLIANSIGAYYSMRAGLDRWICRAYFISPVVDLERLILGMLARAGVTEAELAARGTVPTEDGETLSWDYLCDVRAHPVRWDAPTEILYGSGDALTDCGTISAFAAAHGARLTVMEGGEHWFHTAEQMEFLDAWMLRSALPALRVNGADYAVLRLLGRGKGGYSYLAERAGRQVVVKQLHHEPCDYYRFGDKLAAERHDYGRLRAAGLRIPALLDVDEGAERIVKEYVDGPTVAELLRSGASAAPYLPQVREMAAQARAAGLNIDYYPTNFVLSDGLLWYVDFECNDYMEQWDFEHWGEAYWTGEKEV